MQSVLDTLQPGSLIEGKYQIQRVIGKGGMGVVVAAIHVDLQEVVALKFLLPEALQQRDAVERFLTEARAVRRLRSNHVVKVLDVGRLSDTGLPYMAMELLAGKDLSSVVEDAGPLPIPTACEYVIQACDAIAEAHALGIIHRDIKPANLFALSDSASGRTHIKVLDFGIAKILDGGVSGTRTQTVMGSATYMSPEQMRSTKSVDSRTDIWALGVTLYELLTARHPFEGESMAELVYATTMAAPVSPRAHRGDIPLSLEAIILRCIEKSPEARFRTAGELASALSAFTGNDTAMFAGTIVARGGFVDSPSAGGNTLAPIVTPQPSVLTPAAGVPAATLPPSDVLLKSSGSTAADFTVSKTSEHPRSPAAIWAIAGAVVAAGLGLGVFALTQKDVEQTGAPTASAEGVPYAGSSAATSASAVTSAQVASSAPVTLVEPVPARPAAPGNPVAGAKERAPADKTSKPKAPSSATAVPTPQAPDPQPKLTAVVRPSGGME